eukprot:CAMPEP_0185754902 /NCGR_PEP_ID=MMETSP1174-20130828/13474_1 /TAXON_ID=35687 /ORGANISM="Dictyocha speculum, Strain CCMP1381" /LENGTH=723 /DNA_ID=CAMNT_0028433291 /DNA_START=95 /DNA_END=2262 /DNA_ORIENTATION=-
MSALVTAAFLKTGVRSFSSSATAFQAVRPGGLARTAGRSVACANVPKAPRMVVSRSESVAASSSSGSADTSSDIGLDSVMDKSNDAKIVMDSPVKDDLLDSFDDILSGKFSNVDDLLDDIIADKDEKEVDPNKGLTPIDGFSQVHPRTVADLSKKGFTHFTDIQSQAFLPVFEGRDVIARSRTGTGKTIAFGLPIVEAIAASGRELDRGRAPRLLVMAPTRELARQVAAELGTLGRAYRFSVAVFHGGAPYGPQEGSLRNGIDILVATPGRILDHLNRGGLKLDDVRHVVLDEADEMLDMGFSKDIEEVLSFVDMDAAQTLLFSATTPSWIQRISAQYMTDPLRLDAVGANEQRTATTVAHKAMLVPDNDEVRMSLLEDVITVEAGVESKTIVFTQTKREADELSSGSAFRVLSAGVLHGDLSQKQRDVTLAQFKSGKFKVLVATDVAARGIDISNVDVVVQTSMPQNSDSYVHRAGRTGRAGKKGVSIVLYTQRQRRGVSRLEHEIGHGFKFQKHTAPTPSTVISAAADNAVAALPVVDETVLSYLKDPASKLYEEIIEKAQSNTPEDEAVDVADATSDLIARLLALATGKTEVKSWSLMTGELGITTLMVKAPRALKQSDVVFAVSKLARHGEFEINIGKIQLGKDPSEAVFDLPSSQALKFMQFVEEQDLQKFAFEVCSELPELQFVADRYGGGGGYRGGGRGGGGYRGGGRGGGGYRGG